MAFYILLAIFIASGIGIITMFYLKSFEIKKGETLWIFAFKHKGDYMTEKHLASLREWFFNLITNTENKLLSLWPLCQDLIIKGYEWTRHRADRLMERFKKGRRVISIKNGNNSKVSDYLTSMSDHKKQMKNGESDVEINRQDDKI